MSEARFGFTGSNCVTSGEVLTLTEFASVIVWETAWCSAQLLGETYTPWGWICG